MTDSDLAAIAARCIAATPGWWWNESGTIHAPDWRPDAQSGSVCHPAHTFESNGIDWNADAEFIAHARQDVPALVAEITKLKRLLRPASTLSSTILSYEWRLAAQKAVSGND
jgi:hypothetical protein